MKKNKILFLVLSLFIFAACNQEQKKETVKAIDLSNFDTTTSPKVDFYQYANGGWIKKHPVPNDKSRYGTFDELAEANELKLKGIVDEMLKSTAQAGSVDEKIKFFFETGMDTTKINADGSQPIKPVLAKVDEITDLQSLQKFIDNSAQEGRQFIFNFYGAPDKKNSEMNIAQLAQGGLGLPDKSYYTDKGEKADKIREAYIAHIAKMLELADVEKVKAEEVAPKIFNLENKIADISLTRLERRDEEKTYNKLSLNELDNLMKNFNFKDYFTTIGLSEPGVINVESPDFFKSLDNLLTQTDIDTWKWYLKWHIISRNASYLSDDFVNEQFNFYGKILSGQKELRPRWKRVLSATNSVLSQALGKVYVEKYFPASSKERMEKLITNLQTAFKQRIENLDWMSDSTKKKAIEKLEAITVKVGYPDKWRDYSKLEIKDDSYIKNVWRARKFNFDYMLSKINKPVDRAEWYMPPQMVNAYYNPSNNEIVFPAGILQPPFFFADADDAVNYGAIGVVIGHEMTHGFDDNGRLYDKNGNMNNWWTEQDQKMFRERTQKLVDMFNKVIVIDTIHANGALTLGENIADLGGLNISLTAYKNTDEYKAGKDIDGFTPVQRFFLAYAHIWAQSIRDEEKIRLTKIDVHSLGKNRVNVQVRNLDDFIKAFDVQPGDPMYLAPEDRVKIW